jgi:hypothetical protein
MDEPETLQGQGPEPEEEMADDTVVVNLEDLGIPPRIDTLDAMRAAGVYTSLFVDSADSAPTAGDKEAFEARSAEIMGDADFVLER